MDSEKQKGCSSTTAAVTNVRASRKRKISKGFDPEVELPSKRHGSSSDSPAPSDCSLSPQLASSSLPATSDDEAAETNINTNSISTGGTKEGECSKSLTSSQRDSQTVYSSSFKKNVISKSNKSVPVEVVPSPAESTATEVSEVVDLAELENDILSPLEARDHVEENGVLIKGDKTPHSSRKRPAMCYRTKLDDDPLPCYVTPTTEQRLCPLPMLPWADRRAVWSSMVRKDERASLERDVNMFNNHPGLQPRMRSILLDWLIEVCEVYKLHRETYFLTVDYLDRYLTVKESISKNQLQLIGITCLFIASKAEEIYPPKLHEFAYVTDSACSEEDILNQEILVLQALNWSITPVTIMGWLSIYMQLHDTTGKTDEVGMNPKELLLLNSSKYSHSFIYPQFSGYNFTRTAQLLDLCSLDIGISNFPYSIIAAAAVSHTLGKTAACRVSGLDWSTISPCARWMEPYFQVLEEDADCNPLKLQEMNEQVEYAYGITHVCPNIHQDPSHIIQTHSTSLDTYDKGVLRREQLEAADAVVSQESSPAPEKILSCPPGILTPPASNRKSMELLPK